MDATPPPTTQNHSRNLRTKAWLALILAVGLLYFCLIDGAGGDTLGAVLNGLVAILNVTAGFRFFALARNAQKPLHPGST